MAVTLSQSEEVIEIAVKDNGIGIPKEYHQKIFEPFVSYKVKGASTGLGLAIVKEFVELLEGLIEVESVEGEYTSFKLSLPLLED